jgi:hypothetical protein
VRAATRDGEVGQAGRYDNRVQGTRKSVGRFENKLAAVSVDRKRITRPDEGLSVAVHETLTTPRRRERLISAVSRTASGRPWHRPPGRCVSTVEGPMYHVYFSNSASISRFFFLSLGSVASGSSNPKFAFIGWKFFALVDVI